jgi:DNA-binding MarR family transcriptional regulator
MIDSARSRSRDLFERLARVSAADEWTGDLNPTQLAALSYLARANRFSRAPSQVADYLAATRGTVSQTLRALARKGLIAEHRSELDKRSISYDLTESGRDALRRETALDAAIDALDAGEIAALDRGLEALAVTLLSARGMRAFGVCHTCRHHRPNADGGACALLGVALLPDETHQICHEQETAA